MRPMKRTLSLPVLVLAAACSSTGDCGEACPVELSLDGPAAVATLLTGHFDSAAQAAADEAFFDISLVMQPVWTDRADGPWLYVEQAVSANLRAPYRQRVYHLVQDEGGLRSDVYTLPGDPGSFVHAWEDATAFAGISPDDLALREGCSIWLEPLAGGGDLAFAGATRDQGCSTSLNGAAYATSEVTLEPGRITSWDRGWFADGEQAWGAVTGPYVFDRK